MVRVTLNDLSRLPVERLAQVLLDWAATDRALLSRLHATVVATNATSAETTTSSSHTGVQIIGCSLAIQHVSGMISRFARTDEPVLITGESGTGKELAARAIHDQSRRKEGPFVAVNCAAFPANLVASELFGYEKGAFTGAAARTKGQIEHAHGGTLFLDEIGDMPVVLQGHLLRFLQEGKIVRVGGREAIPVDVRIVAATNVKLASAIGEGRFREDLFYRLNVLTLPLPPLRERPDDIELIANHFLAQAAAQFGRDVTAFTPEALAALRGHTWPGNVRELIATVRRAVVVGDGPVVTVPNLVIRGAGWPAPIMGRLQPGSGQERTGLLDALAGTRENITLAAQRLGVSRVTLYRMLRRHEIVLNRGMKALPMMP